MDPLVPAPDGGFAAWWDRLWAVMRHNWREVLPIVLATYTVPAVIYGLVTIAFNGNLVRTSTGPNGDESVDIRWGLTGGFFVVTVVYAVLAAFLAGLGWAAVIWVITRRATGRPAPFTDALRFGASRCVRLAGLLIVYGILVAIGLVLCIIPGVYIAIAGSLIVPFALFERHLNSIGASFTAVNRNFGAAAGRMAALFGLVLVLGLVIACIGGLAVGGANSLGGGLVNVVVSILETPIYMLIIVGSLLLYAQLRARYTRTSATDLDAALSSST